MVWGVALPSEFNAFSPRGELRGYDEDLAAHYKAERRPGLTPRHPPTFVFTTDRPYRSDGTAYEAFTTYALDVWIKFSGLWGDPQLRTPPLLPVQPHEWPKEFVYARDYKTRASILELPRARCAVEEELRVLIERLDPGIHSFHPIRVVLRTGDEHPLKYHCMVVGRWLESFSLGDSDPGCLSDTDSVSPTLSCSRRTYAGAAMRASVIGDAHLWRERFLRGPRFCFSDRLMEEATAAGLRLPTHFRMKSVA